MKKGFYRGLPVFVDLIDAYEGVPMSDIIKLVNDSPPRYEVVMRRSGRTTRQVDEAIQTLFNYGMVYWVDHAAMPDNMAQRHGFDILVRRLDFEHGLRSSNGLDVSRKMWKIKLTTPQKKDTNGFYG